MVLCDACNGTGKTAGFVRGEVFRCWVCAGTGRGREFPELQSRSVNCPVCGSALRWIDSPSISATLKLVRATCQCVITAKELTEESNE